MSLTDFHEHPGLFFVWATLLPLASFTFLLVASGVRALARPYLERGGEVGTPPRWPAYVATGAIGLAFVLCAIGAAQFFRETAHGHGEASHWNYTWPWLPLGARVLQLGYHIDHLSVIMFLMV